MVAGPSEMNYGLRPKMPEMGPVFQGIKAQKSSEQNLRVGPSLPAVLGHRLTVVSSGGGFIRKLL